MTKRPKLKFFFGVLAVAVVLGVVFLLYSNLTASVDYLAGVGATSTATTTDDVPAIPEIPKVLHLPTPKPTRAIYMTQCAAASPTLRAHLLKIARDTEVNAIVLDLKDYSGTVSFLSTTAMPGGVGCRVRDFAELVKQMHEEGIYVIGRLTVFQDPLYTKTHPTEAVQSLANNAPWKDRKGLSFIDVSAKPFHQYIISLAREAYELGVDEINFDYIRYPSDGNMADTKYIVTGKSHAENLENFFADLVKGTRLPTDDPRLILSADLFGMVTTNYDDLNIGQVLERAMPYFDYIDPMVYPSHFPSNFNGWSNPNQHAYDIIKFTMDHAVARTVATTTKIASLAFDRIGTSTPAVYAKPSYPKAQIRPWLQDFNYPVTYTPEMVKTQIQATYDAGLDSWLMWDPANKYTVSVFKTASSTP